MCILIVVSTGSASGKRLRWPWTRLFQIAQQQVTLTGLRTAIGPSVSFRISHARIFASKESRLRGGSLDSVDWERGEGCVSSRT
ncbi:hypothetical protein Plhal703r1_c10g0053121 [Plasmopara halstedii]